MRAKGKKSTADVLTARCGVTGRRKYPGSMTPEELAYHQTCKLCGFRSEHRLTIIAGVGICDHCNDDQYDEEIRGEGYDWPTIKLF